VARTPVYLDDVLPPPRPLRFPVRFVPETKEDEFWGFVWKRHEMFIRRVIERRPAPWTDDAALANWHYTNVYRELDRVTLDLIERVIRPSATVRIPRLRAFPVIAYRVFNEPETWTALGGRSFLYDSASIERILLDRQAAGETVFRAAYRVQSSRETGEGARIRTWVRRLQEIERHCNGLPIPGTEYSDRRYGMQQAQRWLMSLPGIGDFLAYEILVDLCYAPAVLPFSENDWVNVGPGAALGLRELGLPPSEASIRALAARQREGFARIGRLLRGPDLTLRNVEHSLCEAGKYFRAKAGGKNKRRFHPHSGEVDFSPWSEVDQCYWTAPEPS